MAYYLLIEAQVTNPDKYSAYRNAVNSIIDQYGGRFLVRGGDAVAFEGIYNGLRRVVIEFESKQAARAFWDSPEYAEVKDLREGAAVGTTIGVEGV